MCSRIVTKTVTLRYYSCPTVNLLFVLWLTSLKYSPLSLCMYIVLRHPPWPLPPLLFIAPLGLEQKGNIHKNKQFNVKPFINQLNVKLYYLCENQYSIKLLYVWYCCWGLDYAGNYKSKYKKTSGVAVITYHVLNVTGFIECF